MSRTIVVSDLHGNNAVLERALEHAGFGSGDELVIAGDLIDVGPDNTVALADELGATVLVGNHEVAAALGLRISPQHTSSLDLGPEYARRMLDGTWRLAYAVQGWLVTHAGVSVALDDLITQAHGSPDELAALLDRHLYEEVSLALEHGSPDAEDIDRYRILGGELGPLWFRPTDLARVPAGLRQVVGHTPPEMFSAAERAALDSRGWRLVEPGGHARGAGTRYAVIENGQATVIST